MKTVARRPITLLASVMLLASTVAGASAATAASTASPTGGDITKKQYDVLLRNFTPQEIVELDAISSQAEIQEIVRLTGGSSSLRLAQTSAIPQASAAPLAAATDETNGCSYSPDQWGRADFKPTCDDHDRCYSSTSFVDRLDCDTVFLSGLTASCTRAYPTETIRRNACLGVADVYYYAVRNAGGAFYEGQGLNN